LVASIRFYNFTENNKDGFSENRIVIFFFKI